MTALASPSSFDFANDELFRLLHQVQQPLVQSPLKDEADFRIVSYAFPVTAIDPLLYLKQVIDTQHHYFYWENPAQQQTIVSYGVAQSLTINGPQRFARAQRFVQDCTARLVHQTPAEQLVGLPRFFSHFTFSPLTETVHPIFPAATVVLPKFQLVRWGKDHRLVVNIAVDGSVDLDKVLGQVRQQQQYLTQTPSRFSNLTKINWDWKGQLLDSAQRAAFKTSVTQALRSIERGELHKIVLACSAELTSRQPFDVVYSLQNLRQRYADCYLFAVSNGNGQTFMGASPERLLSIQNCQLITDAIAGSAPRGKTPEQDAAFAQQLINSPKEQREHQVVSDYLRSRLRQLGLSVTVAPRSLLKLSNIQHLHTLLTAALPESSILPLEIVAQLHPTPAVAGVPSRVACDRLHRYETFERSLYAAPLGWLDSAGNAHFVVGIRSALLTSNRARLYAGAGIVAGSDPTKEFAEIQLKLQSLVRALV
ncbi:MAG: isochorismate synthase [Cyanobacteria bacterium P01_H01_bin.15]